MVSKIKAPKVLPFKKVTKKASKKMTNDNQEEIVYQSVGQKVPTVCLIGCGGCGLNIVQKAKFADPDLSEKYQTLLIDTSESNLMETDSGDRFLVDNGSVGSGKFRAKNYVPIITSMTKLISDLKYKLADINIIVFSTSGGSGSVIAPILSQKLLDLDKKVIMLVVSSEDSKIDIVNNLNTYQSLYNIAKTRYLPISIFSNAVKGEATVDTRIFDSIKNLITIFTSMGAEIDYEDKLHFLAPYKTVSDLEMGLHLFHTSDDILDDAIKSHQREGVIFPTKITNLDSMFILSKVKTSVKTTVPAMVVYRGYDSYINSDDIVCSILPTGIPQEYIDNLSKALDNYKSDSEETKFTKKVGQLADDEIVL